MHEHCSETQPAVRELSTVDLGGGGVGGVGGQRTQT